jgi:prepilin-type N-terminal cleavage/methylation domain-containing protein
MYFSCIRIKSIRHQGRKGRRKMLGKISKVLKNQKGFTLVELMTVLIILGVILGIGVPKYLQVQAKAEWEADEATIRNFAKAAETYAASINKYSDVALSELDTAGIIDTDIVLNRINDGSNNSIKNTGTETTPPQAVKANDQTFKFNQETGNVNNLGEVVCKLIGKPPYGDSPTYPNDTVEAGW